MSKRCPDCGFLNEDSRIYCSACGELLDPQLRLLKYLNDQTSGDKKPTYKAAPPRREPIPPRDLFQEEYVPSKLSKKKKKSSAAPWIILGLVVLGAVVWLIVNGGV